MNWLSSPAHHRWLEAEMDRLLDFGRETETVDLSSLALTHYTLKNLGARRLALDSGEGEYKLKPSGPGGGE